jgi:hypothetical protein
LFGETGEVRPGEGRASTWGPPPGPAPYQPWAAGKVKELASDDRKDPNVQCKMAGTPRITGIPVPFEIAQTAKKTYILYESNHIYRIIPTDGRPHIPANIKLFQGDSVGHWEGDTLVVDTTNLNDRTWYDTVGNFHSDAEHVVERFTPVDTTTIKYEATVEDPKVMTKPFKMQQDLYKSTDAKYEQMEFGCIEGNQDVKHYTKDKGGAADIKVK